MFDLLPVTRSLKNKMPYKNWENSQASIAIHVNWFDVNKLVRLLQALRQNLEQGAFYQVPLLLSSNLHIAAPYSKSQRYPGNNTKYFCDTAGKMTQLHFYKNKLYENKDNIRKFLEIVLETINDILQGRSVFDRKTFEAWGGVEWCD